MTTQPHESYVSTDAREERVLHDLRHLLTCLQVAVADLGDQVQELGQAGEGLSNHRRKDLCQTLTIIEQASRLTSHVVRAEEPMPWEEEESSSSLPNAVTVALESVRPLVPTGCIIAIRMPPLPRVLGNEKDLATVLFNLLLNACEAVRHKGATPGNVIEVKAERDRQQVQLTIRDSGVGLRAGMRTKPGCPIGLEICREILASSGGDLELYQASSGGCIAQVRLPLAEPAVVG